MLLCIDIGNTNIKFGLFEREHLCCHWRIATDRTRLADEYAMVLFNLLDASGRKKEDIDGCAISSVVPVLSLEFRELSRRYFGLEPLLIGPEVKTGLSVHTDYPAEVGADLISSAVSARHIYGTPVIIVGFGTATTFTAVSSEGNLEGVAIAPGVITGAESLFRSAAVLPQVALMRPKTAIGKNTINSMQSGLIFGFAALVDGVVERFKAEIGREAKVVATGGLAELIASESQTIQAVESNLPLIGLRLIYELNHSLGT